MSRNVNWPNVPFPATFSSTVFELGCFRSIPLAPPFPENDMFTFAGVGCAYTLARPRVSISAKVPEYFICASCFWKRFDLVRLYSRQWPPKTGHVSCIFFDAPGERAIHPSTLGGNHKSVESLGRR